VAAESPVRKFFTAISALLEQGKVYMAPRKQVNEFFPPPNADLIGYFDAEGEQQVIYLRTEVCLIKAREFWHGLGENLDIMPDALRRQLSQISGLLAKVDGRQVEVSKFCAGINQRVLIVDLQQLEKLYGISLIRSDE
jgi:hypothetical protein